MTDAKSPDEVVVATAVNENVLLSHKGFLVKQDAQVGECCLQTFCCYCIEFDNIYRVAPIPADKKALKALSGDDGWRPGMQEMNDIPKTLILEEDSQCLTTCLMMCCHMGSCRPFTMDLKAGGQNVSYMRIDRECALGGILCCPHTATTSVGGQQVGRVIEDWNCSNYCCRLCEGILCCRTPYKLQVSNNGQWEDRYNINMNFCACGPHFNFCGGTCICNDKLWDVVKADGDANGLGHIQQTYGGCFSPEACVRLFCCAANNFITEWPESATVEERALMMTATILIDYVFFEQKNSMLV